MRALGVIGEQRPATCRYCEKAIVETEIRWKTSDGSKGTSYRPEHSCPALGRVTLSEFIDPAEWGDAGELA